MDVTVGISIQLDNIKLAKNTQNKIEKNVSNIISANVFMIMLWTYFWKFATAEYTPI